jgi:acyl-CoA reductase-like NAD-dependent aldehyde dehydrogenase
VSFDFLVSGFKIGCSVSRDSGFSFSTLDAAPAVSLPSAQSVLFSLVCACLSYVFFRQWRASRFNGVPYSVPVPEQALPGWKGEVLANPSIKSTDDYMIQCYAPATGASLGKVAPAYPEDIDAAIHAAASAQEEWAKTSFDERRKFLRTLLKYILGNQDHIATVACLDSGKTKVDAAFGEILVTVEKIKWVLTHGEKALVPEKREVSWPLQCYKKVELRYEPLGVVAACVSWNYPFHNLLGPIISSTFAGNGIVVKGSEQTAWSSQYFISIVRGALKACGHNPDLVQVCLPKPARPALLG